MNKLPTRIHRYRAYVLTLFCTAALVIGTALLSPSGRRQNQPARSANSFVDSTGINTHLSYDNGYHNATNTTSGNLGVSEEVAGRYIPRLLLEQFNYGIPRTWGYELIDTYNNPNDLEANFGLLRNDGSEKPAYVALKNLLGLLKDPGSNFTAKTLDYALSGDTTNIHHTLLQKRDGKFYLILWQEVSSFDLQTKTGISVPSQPLTLTLNTIISQAAIYEPNNSITPIEKYTKPQQLALQVPDYPLVIELVPA